MYLSRIFDLGNPFGPVGRLNVNGIAIAFPGLDLDAVVVSKPIGIARLKHRAAAKELALFETDAAPDRFAKESFKEL